ncbi:MULTISPECIES: hypothetical protein [unclassified Bradyrhizobium]|uniref:hypothetical protein n=1 Tax=unclassified Bradyrhizobium TaxID=2631580 RepID=UPI001FF838C5|nr:MULTISPECIES: hypothetical protein [unclassified Bradyrhizobium]MCK1317392.1 hypothetical protein [Bradyrhizobium sp. 23]MCK1510676.1 hypothetical protein [Bradyrhizobium sp. 18]MCK1630709.1 hypothetical protein [Bradyrhizobium sp. 162]MCK1694406.1 hypothetical protein [Bradyrhizobium sp. 144]
MWNSDRLPSGAFLRALLLLFGVVGSVWSSLVLPSFQLTAPARNISARIIADESFKPGALGEMLLRTNAVSEPPMIQPEFSQSQALITLRAAEEAILRKTPEEADHEIEAAQNKVKAALAVAPTDSFLWLMLYSAEISRSGFDLQIAHYLGQSYAAGPLEGWISLRRNRLALAVFAMLSEVVQRATISEFSNMVSSGFVDQAATNLATVGWSNRDRLLAALTQVDITDRQSLAKQLLKVGVNVTVPGVEREERPWQ